MRRTYTVLAIASALIFNTMGMAFGAINAVTPSTNETNEEIGWAHFNVADVRVGAIDIEFVSTRNFASCFEYRSDGADRDDPRETSTQTSKTAYGRSCV